MVPPETEQKEDMRRITPEKQLVGIRGMNTMQRMGLTTRDTSSTNERDNRRCYGSAILLHQGG